MKKLLSLFVLSALASAVGAQSPWENGRLRVSDDGRYLQHANGQPFFWLGDTCWLISQKLTREEVKTYFENRKAKGFNAVQCVVVQTLADQNVYGDSAIVDGDISRLGITPGDNPADPEQYDYWDHVDYIVDAAAANGIYLVIAPTWGHTVRRVPITTEKATPFAAAVAERLKDKPNLIWLNGGSARGNESTDVWQAIGETIKKHDPVHLMTFHPFGRSQSSTWFGSAPWLDLNMFTSGHRRYDQDTEGRRFGEDNWRYVLEDLARTPRKPTIDGEPAYEDTPQGLHDGSQPYWTDSDVRRYAYWSVFAGAAGHTFGQNSVRQVYMPRDARPSSGARGYFADRLDSPGATQLRHLKALILSRPYFDRVNDQSVVAGDEGERYDRVLVTRGKDFLFAYTYTGRTFKIQMGGIGGSHLDASWFNPRTGEVTKAGRYENKGAVSFDPPGDAANGNDWVLVLDDAAMGFRAPGLGS